MSDTPRRFDDLGIDQHHQRVAALGDVDHDDLLVHVDLGRGEADPGAAYMVSAMSATSFLSASSNTVTGAATLCSRASG